MLHINVNVKIQKKMNHVPGNMDKANKLREVQTLDLSQESWVVQMINKTRNQLNKTSKSNKHPRIHLII